MISSTKNRATLFRVPEPSSIWHPIGVKVSLTETQLFNSLLAALPTAVRVTRAPTEMVKL
jgi:hypothetical protein